VEAVDLLKGRDGDRMPPCHHPQYTRTMRLQVQIVA
jgi:hypothetical protein